MKKHTSVVFKMTNRDGSNTDFEFSTDGQLFNQKFSRAEEKAISNAVNRVVQQIYQARQNQMAKARA
jgi:hypothetical protein